MKTRLLDKMPARSLSLTVAALPALNRVQGRRTLRNRWDVRSELAESLPLWEATDRVHHRRLTFDFHTRAAYLETLRNLAELWTLEPADTFTLY